MPSIACLGWGSLIWDPRTLPLASQWHSDGPELCVEFVRQSADDRITLVIDPSAAPLEVLWARLDVQNLAKARTALADRERCQAQHVGCWSVGEAEPASIPLLEPWARSRAFDAVVWTALPARYHGLEATPTIEQVLAHLRALRDEKLARAEAYIRRAPRQIMTTYRRRIETELGWYPRE